MRRVFRPLLSLVTLVLWPGRAGLAAEDYEQPPVSYSASKPADAITRLEVRLASGDATLGGSDRAVLAALLRELGVPVASQLLVFSKTSLQRGRIGPAQPRALYFSDTCYVGWVPGGLIEVTAIDAQLGPVFYTLDPRAPVTRRARRFERDDDCLRCHGGNFVRGIPGVFARSVFPDATGEPLFRHGTTVVDYRTPFEERWGGWYVTGRHDGAPHRGNRLAREEHDALVFPLANVTPVTDLSPYFDVTRYLAPTSDLIALLVFEHQTAVQNALTHAAFDARRMLHYQAGLERAFGDRASPEPAYDSVKSVFASATRSVVDALLLKDEAPLPAGLAGAPEFVRAFEAAGPRTRDGRSLRDLSLDGHLLRHRCSPLIYSEMFLGLSPPLKRQICAALAHALDPVSPDSRYAYLTAAERAALRAILRETHPDLRELPTGGQ